MQRPVQGESLPFPSPKPDSEAMKSAQTVAAISSNEKIFPIFAQKLASKDMKEFVHTAHKLTVWLSSEKAYYPAARSKIIELLEIARSAFLDTFMHRPAAAELAEHLRQLIQAVTPFKHRFLEDELQSRLQRLISDINLSLSVVSQGTIHGNVQPQGSVATKFIPTIISSPTLTSSVHPQPISTAVSGTMLPIQPPNAVQAVPNGSVYVDTPQVRNPPQIASSSQTKAIQSISLPVTNTPQGCENVSPTIPSKPQPKRTRRAELPEELKARDLDWFKSQQVPAIVKEDPGASSSRTSESLLALAPDTSYAITRSPSPKKKTARMVPSRRLPRRVPLNAAQEVESDVFTSACPPVSEPSPEKAVSFENAADASVQMNVDEQNPSPEEVALDVCSAEIPDCPFVPIPETTLDRVESMDISDSDVDHESLISEPPSRVDPTPLQSNQLLPLRTLILPPPVTALEPPLNLNFRISQISLTQPRQLEMDANQQRFDGKMTVVHSTQGKPFTHTHTIDINLNEGIFSKISKWVRRKSQPSEAPHGACISLACYRLPELFDVIKSESGQHDVEELTSQSSCSWPCSDRLSLYVNDSERKTTIPLSPPLFLTPDQCVDISSLMKLGNNTLEIRQQDDMSEYLVVLHAHLPTRAQLAEFEVVKMSDERWKQFLDALSARAVPKKMHGTPPASAVGVF